MAQAVPNLCVSMTVFLKQQVNWAACGAIPRSAFANVWSAHNSVEVLNEHCLSAN